MKIAVAVLSSTLTAGGSLENLRRKPRSESYGAESWKRRPRSVFYEYTDGPGDTIGWSAGSRLQSAGAEYSVFISSRESATTSWNCYKFSENQNSG